MEVNRLELSDILSSVMEKCGEEPHLYFQPPESVKLEYPCIIYHMRNLDSRYANDRPYKIDVGYDVMYITRSPISKVPVELVKLPSFRYDRYYTSNGLYHYAYTTVNTLKEVSND